MTDVYGTYSLGSGAILSDPDRVWAPLADPEVLASYDRSMREDMARAGLSLDAIGDWNVMDVGTGRQALTFARWGARVAHYDMSTENVDRVRHHIAACGFGSRVVTRCADIVQADLGRAQFDLVYLNGVAQHFSDVGAGLARCVRALKPGGYLWLYFYRSGTFDNFVLYALRVMMHGSNTAPQDERTVRAYRQARLFFSETAADTFLSSAFMDGVWTRHARLYVPDSYLRFAQLAGLEVVSSSGLDPVGRLVDHRYARAASVVTLRLAHTVTDPELDIAADCLNPDGEVNQLDPNLYHETEIRDSLQRLEALRPRLSDENRGLVVMRLFAALVAIRKGPPDQRHTHLQKVLSALEDIV